MGRTLEEEEWVPVLSALVSPQTVSPFTHPPFRDPPWVAFIDSHFTKAVHSLLGKLHGTSGDIAIGFWQVAQEGKCWRGTRPPSGEGISTKGDRADAFPNSHAQVGTWVQSQRATALRVLGESRHPVADMKSTC